MNGILLIDKQPDWTSNDVVAKLKGILHQRRIGHSGTLDPMATGLLVVFVGRATRAVEFFEHAEKEYVAGLRLGVQTDTQDLTGEIVAQRPVSVTREQVQAALEGFLGVQEQLPPMYSAVKIGGKKLYELARQGKTVERKPRQIELLELELLSGENADWQFRVRCSKGTYVRTLCHDIGQALGCGGCMSSLRRTKAGGYGLDRAVTMEEIIAMDDPAACLLPVDSVFERLPQVTAHENQLRAIYNGAAVKASGLADGPYRDNKLLK